jgi:hypothetical protein
MKKWNLSVSDLGSWGVDALKSIKLLGPSIGTIQCSLMMRSVAWSA